MTFDGVDIASLYVLTIKILGIGASYQLMHKGLGGIWPEMLFKYFLMSFLFFIILFVVLGKEHLDPSATSIDIIAVCWLWHRSKDGVRTRHS
ncbi:MAG: hypothetical protein R8K20_11960 [Gallionellaceae bacterium]